MYYRRRDDDELVFVVKMIKVVVVFYFNITFILIIYLCFLLHLIFLGGFLLAFLGHETQVMSVLRY
jgi:hypothetical protein